MAEGEHAHSPDKINESEHCGHLREQKERYLMNVSELANIMNSRPETLIFV
jgi:hypothetical protein